MGSELRRAANSCWIYSERAWLEQLFLSHRNVGTTGASFVLAEPVKGMWR